MVRNVKISFHGNQNVIRCLKIAPVFIIVITSFEIFVSLSFIFYSFSKTTSLFVCFRTRSPGAGIIGSQGISLGRLVILPPIFWLELFQVTTRIFQN